MHMSKIKRLHKINELKLNLLIFLKSSKVEEDNKMIMKDMPNIPEMGINPFTKKLSMDV